MYSRFYAQPLAELITRKGRETLQRTVELATHELNLDVVYGDTDSIMVNSRTEDLGLARKIGGEVKKKVRFLLSYTSLGLT